MPGTIGGVVVVTVALLPLAVLVAWERAAPATVGMIYGTVPWVWMIMLPGDGPGRVNLVPLRDLAAVLASGPLTATVQIAGNLLVFAALGFFGPMRFAALASAPRMLAVGAAGSILVETLQHTLALGRVSSVDDVLLNAAGAGLAALASRRWRVRETASGAALGAPASRRWRVSENGGKAELPADPRASAGSSRPDHC